MFNGKRPRDVTLADLDQMISEEWPESDQLEFNGALPARKGGNNDPWAEKRELSEAARNGLLEEIMAFANGHGGWLLVGVEETKEKPGKASSLKPIVDCSDLADRLRKTCRDCIDPPLPIVEIEGVEAESGGIGVIVAYVPRSRAGPHRLTPSLHCYVRRHDSCEKMNMREIQDLTLNLTRGDAVVEQALERARARFHDCCKDVFRTGKGLPGASGVSGFGIRASAAPVTPLYIDMLGREAAQHAPLRELTAKTGEHQTRIMVPLYGSDVVALLRGKRWTNDRNRSDNFLVERDIYRDGVVDYRLVRKFDEPDEAVLFPGWVMALSANAMLAIERFRELAGAPSVEFAFELEIFVKGLQVPLMGYGSQRLSPIGRAGIIPIGSHQLPIYALGSIDDFSEAVALIEQDFFNLAGYDSQRDFTLDFGGFSK
ncbi:MAG TPA: ATP-binding protein [Thermohalobaculum sp.]|nr:ATP-binding protein [Thermohalobaculum sp.]